MSLKERAMLYISFWSVIFLIAVAPDKQIPVHIDDRVVAFIAGIFIMYWITKFCYFLIKDWNKA